MAFNPGSLCCSLPHRWPRGGQPSPGLQPPPVSVTHGGLPPPKHSPCIHPQQTLPPACPRSQPSPFAHHHLLLPPDCRHPSSLSPSLPTPPTADARHVGERPLTMIMCCCWEKACVGKRRQVPGEDGPLGGCGRWPVAVVGSTSGVSGRTHGAGGYRQRFGGESGRHLVKAASAGVGGGRCLWVGQVLTTSEAAVCRWAGRGK